MENLVDAILPRKNLNEGISQEFYDRLDFFLKLIKTEEDISYFLQVGLQNIVGHDYLQAHKIFYKLHYSAFGQLNLTVPFYQLSEAFRIHGGLFIDEVQNTGRYVINYLIHAMNGFYKLMDQDKLKPEIRTLIKEALQQIVPQYTTDPLVKEKYEELMGALTYS